MQADKVSFELMEYWDISKECWRVGRRNGSNVEALSPNEERAALWKVFELQEQKQRLEQNAHEFKQLRDALGCDGGDLPQLLARIQMLIGERDWALKRIDRLTEYLRHGPTCPAEITNLKEISPICDCGLREMLIETATPAQQQGSPMSATEKLTNSADDRGQAQRPEAPPDHEMNEP